MNRGWVQYIGAVAPWRKIQRSIIDKYIQIRRTAAASSVSRQPSYISVLLQIMQRSLYRGAGAVELGGNSVDPRQHLRSLSDLSRKYIYTVFALMGKLLSEYIVEK